MATEILLIQGWALGSVYALVAFGFVATYSSNRLLNFALPYLGAAGLLAMSSLLSDGAFGVSSLRGKNPLTRAADHPIGWLVCFLAALLVAAGVGMVTERVAIRPLAGRSPFVLTLATLAVTIIMQPVLVQSPIGRRIEMPWGTRTVRIGDADVSISTLVVCVAAPLVLLGLRWFHRTWFGLTVRAMAADEEAARSVGINRGRVLAGAWALAAILATLAAVAFTVPPLGAGVFSIRAMPDLFFRAIPVLAIGGWDSYGGAYAAGITIGMVQIAVGGWFGEYASVFGAGYTAIIPYVIMVVVLMIRPSGLFGQATIRRV